MPPPWAPVFQLQDAWVSSLQKAHASPPKEVLATHWHCDQCTNENLWATTPSCMICDHRRCNSCKYVRIEEKDQIAPPLDYTTPKSRPLNRKRRPLPVSDREYQDSVWRCHCCRTFCVRGDESKDGWKCRACRHLMCWECSASFGHAALGMSVLLRRRGRSSNVSEIRGALTMLHSVEALSSKLCLEDVPMEDSGPLRDSIMEPALVVDEAIRQTIELHRAQLDNLQQRFDTRSFALERSQSQLDAKSRALTTLQEQHSILLQDHGALQQKHGALQHKHDKLQATYSPPEWPPTSVEQNTPSSSRKVIRASESLLSAAPSILAKKELPGHQIAGADHSSPNDQSDGLRDAIRTVCKSPLEREGTLLPLETIRRRGEHRIFSPSDTIYDVSWSQNSETQCESEGEMDFAGTSSDGGSGSEWSPASMDTDDATLISSIVKELVCLYLQELDRRQSGQRQHATSASTSSGSVPASPQRLAATLLVNEPGASGINSKARQNEKRKRDDSDDEGPPQKRRQTNNSTQGKKPFACPYWKYDKVRYSENNTVEKHYRRCASSNAKKINHLKQHLFRVHKRPEYYCLRCLASFTTYGLLNDHNRAQVMCSLSEPPFEEKMTPDQAKAIKRRRATKDQVAAWYYIYETLFPGCIKPDTPYAGNISSESIEDFEQWFDGQSMVLRDLISNRVAGVFRRMSQDERDVLETIIEECLSELARIRGPDFHLSPSGAVPPNWAAPEFEIHGTTALEVAESLGMLDTQATPVQKVAAESCPAEMVCSNDDLHEDLPEDESQNNSPAPSSFPFPVLLHGSAPLHFSDPVSDDWVLDYPPTMLDTFDDEIFALGHDSSVHAADDQDENALVDAVEPLKLHLEETVSPGEQAESQNQTGEETIESPLADCEFNTRAKPGLIRKENLRRHVADKHSDH